LKSASNLGVLAALNQHDNLAQQQIQSIDTMANQFTFVKVPYYKARIIANQNNIDEALNPIETAIDQGAQFYVNNVFENDPLLKMLKMNERFQAMVHPEQ